MFILINRKLKVVIISIFIAIVLFVGVLISLRMLYPMEYKSYIYKYSKQYDLDPHLVAAIINVESKYDKSATSSKDARGLMQIAPSTANWASEELKIEKFTLESLYSPEINISIGCWYLDVLGKEFNNDIELILAAYNGGSGNVNKWLEDNRYCSDGKKLTNIPFKETREYVEKVKSNYNIYKKIYKNAFNEYEGLESHFISFVHIFRRVLKQFFS